MNHTSIIEVKIYAPASMMQRFLQHSYAITLYNVCRTGLSSLIDTELDCRIIPFDTSKRLTAAR